MNIRIILIILLTSFVVSCNKTTSTEATFSISNYKSLPIVRLTLSPTQSTGKGQCLGTDILGGTLNPGGKRTVKTSICGSKYYVCYEFGRQYAPGKNADNISCGKTYTVPIQ